MFKSPFRVTTPAWSYLRPLTIFTIGFKNGRGRKFLSDKELARLLIQGPFSTLQQLKCAVELGKAIAMADAAGGKP